MLYTEQEAIEQNFKVLAGLNDFFRLLGEHGAVIGRDRVRVVIDLTKVPSIALDEVGEIFRTSTLVAPSGMMGIFQDCQSDDETGVLLLNIGSALKDGDSIFSKYPAFNEVRELFDGIPLLSQEQSETFAALHEALDAHFMGLLMTHREAIFEGLFGGGDGPNWSNDDPQEKRLN